MYMYSANFQHSQCLHTYRLSKKQVLIKIENTSSEEETENLQEVDNGEAQIETLPTEKDQSKQKSVQEDVTSNKKGPS